MAVYFAFCLVEGRVVIFGLARLDETREVNAATRCDPLRTFGYVGGLRRVSRPPRAARMGHPQALGQQQIGLIAQPFAPMAEPGPLVREGVPSRRLEHG